MTEKKTYGNPIVFPVQAARTPEVIQKTELLFHIIAAAYIVWKQKDLLSLPLLS